MNNMTTNHTTNALSTLAVQRIQLKAQIDALTEQLKDLDSLVIGEFQSAGITKVETDLGNVNLVQSNTIVWNEEVLHEILTKAQWDRVTVRKVDKVRLDAELTVGRIDADLVEVAKTVKQSKPFLR